MPAGKIARTKKATPTKIIVTALVTIVWRKERYACHSRNAKGFRYSSIRRGSICFILVDYKLKIASADSPRSVPNSILLRLKKGTFSRPYDTAEGCYYCGVSQEKSAVPYYEGQPPLEVHYAVPFYYNRVCSTPGDQCLVANIMSVLGYFMPNNGLDRQQVAQLCGYERGKGAWQTQSLLSLAELGFETRWIEDADVPSFAIDPEAYMRKCFPDPTALRDQLANSNIPLEARRVASYLERGLSFERRPGTKEDIITLLADGYLARVPINAAVLEEWERPSCYSPRSRWTPPRRYDPHSVLIVGYDEKGVSMHDADSNTYNKPNRFVPWETLERAWAGFSSTRALNAYKLPLEEPA